MSAPSEFALKLAAIAKEQHTTFHLLDEADPELCSQIEKYWEDLNLGFTSCVTVPWSAVFVSWCVKQAGATAAEFKFAAAHSVFVHKAIENARNQTGVFRGREITAHPPSIGDIIQNNRGGTDHNFAFARDNENYASHSAIVVEIGQDATGRFALTIGGNEGNSIRQTIVRLTTEGFIRQRASNPFICIIATMK
jgi:hypothetical protein